MAKTINDPVFGELTYDDVKQAWTKRIPLGIWFDDDYTLDLVVSCRGNGLLGVSVNEEITDKQREAYKSYLDNLQTVRKEFGEILLSYYKDHYEYFNRTWDLDDDLKNDDDRIPVLGYFDPLQLFIDRKGNYGWLSTFISDSYEISVVLSDGKPRIFEGWNILKLDYGRVDDEVFGEMFFDQGWKRWIKTDINGIEGEMVVLEADSFIPEDEITSEQRTNYQKYLQREKTFLAEYPKVLLKYYKENYHVIIEIWDEADLYDAKDMDEGTIKSLVQFQKLFFNMTGTRYGWMLMCPWDDVDGLSLYYDNEDDNGIHVGNHEDLSL